MNPSLSVVVPCRDEEETVGELMGSLVRQEWSEPWEVLVADNGCSDRSMEVVEGYRDRLPGLRILDASDVRGVSHARNTGIRHARGEAVVFVDADDVVAAGWLAALGEALSEHDFVASRHDNERLNEPWLVEARGQVQAEELGQIWFPPFLEVCGGVGMGVNRELLLEIGGFREEFMRLQDTDLSLRLQYEGASPVLVHDAVVYMRFRDEMSSVFRQARTWAEYVPLLYRVHCPAGWERDDQWRRLASQYRWLGARILHGDLTNPVTRFQLAWQAGWQIGLLAGSLRHRVAPPVWIPKADRSPPPDDPTMLKQLLADRPLKGDLKTGGRGRASRRMSYATA